MELRLSIKDPVYCVCYREDDVIKTIGFFKDEQEAYDCYWKRKKELEKLGEALSAVDSSYFFNEKNYSEDNEDAYPCYTGRAWVARERGRGFHTKITEMKEVSMCCCNDADVRKI